MRAAAPFGRVSRAGRAESYPVRVSPFRRLVRPPRGESGCCAVVKVHAACLAGARACLPLVAAWLQSLPFAAALVRRRPSCRGRRLAAAACRGRLPCQGLCGVCRVACLILSRRGRSSSRRVCVAACPCLWRPCRRACGGLPSGLCRWPYLACAWRLAPPGCLWRPCRRGPGVRGVFVFRPSLWHHDTTFFGVCPTSKALTISLLSCARATNIKISKWLFCCFFVPCGTRI